MRPESSTPPVTGESCGSPPCRRVATIILWRGRTKASRPSRSTVTLVAMVRGMPLACHASQRLDQDVPWRLLRLPHRAEDVLGRHVVAVRVEGVQLRPPNQFFLVGCFDGAGAHRADNFEFGGHPTTRPRRPTLRTA